MAVIVALAIIVVPALQIAMLAWLLWFARDGRKAPQFNRIMQAWERLHPWSMVEVGLLAALVAIFKLNSLVHVSGGIGIWAVAALAILLTALTHRDCRSLWMVLMPRAA